MSNGERSIPHTSRLPEGWSEVDRVSDVIEIDGVDVHRAGAAATSSGEEITGSAAAAGEGAESTAARASYELLERVATLEAISRSTAWTTRRRDARADAIVSAASLFPESPNPDTWRFARSNGVALHESWEEACSRAELELIERHRALEAWLGRAGRERIANVEHPVVAASRTYAWQTHRLLPSEGCFSAGVEVALVVGFAREGGPMGIGFGAGRSLEAAARSATCEAVQLLSFLWGEPVNEDPSASVTDAMAHLEHHQTARGQGALRSWLGTDAPAAASSSRSGLAAMRFVDLTPEWLTGMRVVKAVHADALPLTFGESPYMHGLSADRRLHPIP